MIRPGTAIRVVVEGPYRDMTGRLLEKHDPSLRIRCWEVQLDMRDPDGSVTSRTRWFAPDEVARDE